MAPVVAGQILKPGEHVGWMDETKTTVGRVVETLGAVDPYLTKPVRPGQKFYLFLYPQSIQSLRHVWTHPAFPEEFKAATSYSKAESEQWLRDWITSADCPDYESLMELFDKGSLQMGDSEYYGPSHMDGEYVYINGQDAHAEIPLDFWLHVENVLGKTLRDKPRWFSCSC
jgi:hypothetical protein